MRLVKPATPWANRAACLNHPAPDLWFPSTPDGGPGGTPGSREAKAICARCPVRRECLEYALGHEEFGIWGGTGERERRHIRRARARERRAA